MILEKVVVVVSLALFLWSKWTDLIDAAWVEQTTTSLEAAKWLLYNDLGIMQGTADVSKIHSYEITISQHLPTLLSFLSPWTHSLKVYRF